MSVKSVKGSRKSLAARLWDGLKELFLPKNSLPCVGLVVLGGCLTLVVMPDEAPPAPRPVKADGRPELPTIIVDPGHGGRDDGTKWYGVSEQDLTLDIAYRLEKKLRDAGFPTMLTRRDRNYMALEERVRMANKVEDAIFISLHFNSDGTGVGTGIETYYARRKALPGSEWTWVGFFAPQEPDRLDESDALAGAVQTSLILKTEAKNRGIHSSNFYVVHHTKHPAVLVECGFISNLLELQMLANVEYRERVAGAIVEGVQGFQQTRKHTPTAPAVPRLAKLDIAE